MARRLTLFSRNGCHLCAEMRTRLDALSVELGFEVDEIDVDGDPQLAARFNAKVPVLAYEGEIICCHRLDESELRDALAHE